MDRLARVHGHDGDLVGVSIEPAQGGRPTPPPYTSRWRVTTGQGSQRSSAISRMRWLKMPVGLVSCRRARRSASNVARRGPNRCGAEPEREKTAATTWSAVRSTTAPGNSRRRGPLKPAAR